MNRAGVSLMPATSPMPTPAHRRRSGPNRSATTTARMTTLTCPSCSDNLTGSTQATRPTSMAPMVQSPVAAVIPSPRSIRSTAYATSAQFAANPRICAVSAVTRVNGTKHSAANGL